MPTVAGIDSSTQSCKVVVCDADTGVELRRGRAEHPGGTEVEPRAWWEALQRAADRMLDGVDAIGVAGQQHGMVALDDTDQVVRPALLWNDTRSAASSTALVAELGGPQAWARAVGSVPLASYTVTKLRWLADNEPRSASRVARVLLPHDWLTWQLRGCVGEPTTDRGDASGTGYWSPTDGRYREDLPTLALGHAAALPRVARPAEVVGETATGALLAAGTGDNMAAAVALGVRPGDVVVPLGTSGTASAPTPTPTRDPTGTVAGFADATGRFLPLVCTLNAARVLTAAAQLLDTDLAGLDALAGRARPGADGLVLLPFLDGERTPNLPQATGSLHGLTRAAMTPHNLARAAVEGMLCGLAEGVDALAQHGVAAGRVLLVGGGARSVAVRSIAADVFGVPVVVPPPKEYVARGAARLAAWAAGASPEPPPWGVEGQGEVREPTGVGEHIRERYAAVRHQHASAPAPGEQSR